MANLIGWLIGILLVLAHSLGFWLVYKWASRSNELGFAAIGGSVAGLTGWFWVCFGYIVWRWNEGSGYTGVIWLYGLIIAPFIGTLFTIFFWKLIDRLNLRIGVLVRALFGTVVGVTIGTIIGATLDLLLIRQYGAQYAFLFSMNFIVAPIACASAIMAGSGGKG